MLANYFDPRRFWLLMKLELFKARKGVVMTFVITFGALFFIDLLLSNVVEITKVTHDHTESYSTALMLGGFILSSLAFSDLGSALKRYQYLTLPVSTLERFLCMWLLTSVGWILLFTVTYTLYTLVANLIGPLFFRQVTFLPFDPLGSYPVLVMKSYFALQGIYLIGAAHFRGYVFAKTFFALVLFIVLCGTIIILTLVDVFTAEHDCMGYDCILIAAAGKHPVRLLAESLFWWALAPLCWVLTYMGLKEQEA